MHPSRGGESHGVRRPAAEEFSARFSAALERRSMTMARLQARLRAEGHHVGLSTLSYWRRGERRPEHLASLEAVAVIEELLGLEEGHLLDSLPPSRRPGPQPPTQRLTDLAGLTPTTSQELIVSYGFDTAQQKVATTSVHMTVDVDGHRNDHCVTTRLGLRAVADEVARFPVGIAGLENGELAELVSVRGGRVVRSDSLAEIGMQAWELTLERPIRVNETSVLELTLALPGTRHDFAEYYIERAVRELVIWVRFTPGVVPRSAEAYVVSDGTEATTPLDLAGLTSISFSAAPYGPGTAGLRWSW